MDLAYYVWAPEERVLHKSRCISVGRVLKRVTFCKVSVTYGDLLSCRHLNRNDFSVFLQRYCLLSDTKLPDIADDMIQKLSQPDQQSDTPSDADVQLQLQALSTQQV